jgi:hypothetical protein
MGATDAQLVRRTPRLYCHCTTNLIETDPLAPFLACIPFLFFICVVSN